MKVVVIDGQGGKIGKLLIEQIKRSYPAISIVAIGTNSIATAGMMKAGADYGATGENPIIVNVRDADAIIGPMGIIIADSLLGEITPAIATAVCQSKAQKILIPLNKCSTTIVGMVECSLAEAIQMVIIQLAKL